MMVSFRKKAKRNINFKKPEKSLEIPFIEKKGGMA
jgi:hypothetical protein